MNRSQFIILLHLVLLIATVQSYCLISTSAGQCAQCSQSFYLTTNYTCSPCSQGCIQCLSSNQCLTCNVNYFLSSSSCQMGPQNCLYVNNNGSCNQCILGFYSNQLDCSPCLPFCTTCNGPNIC